MNFRIVTGVIIIAIIVLSGIIFMNSQTKEEVRLEETSGGIKYLPIGDSYTIGNGVLENDRWPNVLVKHLKEAGVKVSLAGNPAVSGYTVDDAFRRELPVVRQLQPDFVTVFIGTNDNFRGGPVGAYKQDLKGLLDELQSILKNPKGIVLITIPDYSYSPAAVEFNREGLSESIQEYNKVIKAEGLERGLLVADIFPISQTMTGDSDYIPDGLHPSAEGYKKWEEVIYPVVFEFLKK